MNNLDFSFLDENLVYKILTRKSGHLNSFKNVEFIMTQDNLEVFFDYPELPESLLIDWFDHFEIIQDGEKISSLDEYKLHNESLALFPLKNGNKNIFLVRAS